MLNPNLSQAAKIQYLCDDSEDRWGVYLDWFPAGELADIKFLFDPDTKFKSIEATAFFAAVKKISADTDSYGNIKNPIAKSLAATWSNLSRYAESAEAQTFVDMFFLELSINKLGVAATRLATTDMDEAAVEKILVGDFLKSASKAAVAKTKASGLPNHFHPKLIASRRCKRELILWECIYGSRL